MIQNSYWRGILAKLPDPQIPAWSTSNKTEDRKESEWKYNSGYRNGFYAAIHLLLGE